MKFSFRQKVVCGQLSELKKKCTSPPPPSLLVHAKGRTIWILSWRGVGRIKKISVFFSAEWPTRQMFLSAALIVTAVLRLKNKSYSNCLRVQTLRTVLTCDHAVLLPFLFWRRGGKDAWYIYFTLRSFFSRPPTFALSRKKSLIAVRPGL